MGLTNSREEYISPVKLTDDEIHQRVRNIFSNPSHTDDGVTIDTIHWNDSARPKVKLPQIGASKSNTPILDDILSQMNGAVGAIGNNVDHSEQHGGYGFVSRKQRRQQQNGGTVNKNDALSELSDLQRLKEYLHKNMHQDGGCGCAGDDDKTKQPKGSLGQTGGAKKRSRKMKRPTKSSSSSSSTPTPQDEDDSDSDRFQESSISVSVSTNTPAEFSISDKQASDINIVPFYSSDSNSDFAKHLQTKNRFF